MSSMVEKMSRALRRGRTPTLEGSARGLSLGFYRVLTFGGVGCPVKA